MYIFRRAADLQAFLQKRRTHGRSVGFVPTMGALHRGHLSLVDRAQQENQLTVASIFVNPTQFNQAEDLQHYPRTPGKDCELLAEVGCGLVFLPTVAEVYPYGPDHRDHNFDFQGLDSRLEGEHRPGHFTGVAQVVSRLLQLVRPDRLYLGQKDYQQVAVLRSMAEQLRLELDIVQVPTVRAEDGLALSSRNERLTKEARTAAPAIFQALVSTSAGLTAGQHPAKLIAKAIHDLNQTGPLKVEYFEIVDGKSLLPVADPSQHETIVIVAAVWAGDVRLIDNLPV
ncbi:MAG: pantoate--beta-alanine ligase [Bacteroidota bacterium]